MNESQMGDDDALWAAACEGDGKAFGLLFERYCDLVYNYTFRRTGNWDAAEDAVSAVFLEAWRQRDRIVLLEGSLRPWLLGVASNMVKRWWRANERSSKALKQLQVNEDVADHASSVAGRIDDQDRLRRVLHHMGDLPEGHRDVLLLSVWEKLSYEEIAVTLRVPVGTVRSRLNRARAALLQSDCRTRAPQRSRRCDVDKAKECQTAGEWGQGGLA